MQQSNADETFYIYIVHSYILRSSCSWSIPNSSLGLEGVTSRWAAA